MQGLLDFLKRYSHLFLFALLEGAGLAPEHIAVSADCTSCLPEKYWSHRYTHGQRGSQAAMIALL